MTHFMYLFCLLVWGLNFIAIKIQGNEVNSEVSLFYRLALAAVFFFVLCKYLKVKIKINKKVDLFFIFTFGICNFSLSYLSLYYATIWSTSTVVVLIFSLKCIITPIFLRLFLDQPMSSRLIVGGILGIFGVIILLYPKMSMNVDINFIKGIALAIIGTIIAALGDAVSSRNAKESVPPILANFLGFTFASIFLFLFCLFNSSQFHFSYKISYISSLFYLVIFASFLAWIFYLKLIEKMGASQSGFMVSLFPIVGGIASVVIGESQININLIFACILSSAGAAVALGVNTKRATAAIKNEAH